MRCGKCKRKIEDEGNFCPYCGSPIEIEQSGKRVVEVENDSAEEVDLEYEVFMDILENHGNFSREQKEEAYTWFKYNGYEEQCKKMHQILRNEGDNVSKYVRQSKDYAQYMDVCNNTHNYREEKIKEAYDWLTDHNYISEADMLYHKMRDASDSEKKKQESISNARIRDVSVWTGLIKVVDIFIILASTVIGYNRMELSRYVYGSGHSGEPIMGAIFGFLVGCAISIVLTLLAYTCENIQYIAEKK